MDVILTHHTLENLDLEGFAGLADEFPSFVGYIPISANLSVSSQVLLIPRAWQ